MFIRGGIDDKVFRPLCMNAETSECSISIQVNSLGTGTPWTSYDAWRNGDTKLEWFGTQAGLGTYLGSSAFGTPLAWTKSNSTLPEYQKLTKWGDYHHMVDFDMDCSETEGGWFDVKAYINNFASGWETDIVPSPCTGSGTTGPSSLFWYQKSPEPLRIDLGLAFTVSRLLNGSLNINGNITSF
uniref:Uncharacterized protein n=1 Tax=Daphnia galeata TaxID=27404 RepID=A0A8J2RL65_9CRUS|nr:unnamed protein product [Daphnia galeata]